MNVSDSQADVLLTAMAWLDEGAPVTLATVVRTWGSSPRPAGSIMAIGADHRIAGSVSGGCVEEELLRTLTEFPLPLPRVVTYGASEHDRARLKIPCGAKIGIVLEPLRSASELRSLLEIIHAGAHVTRVLDLTNGQTHLLTQASPTPLCFDGTTLRHTYGPDWRLLVVGANDVARYTCMFAMTLGFAITVCDPREEYVRSWDLPGIAPRREMPDDVIQEMKVDRQCAIVALAHDPRVDDMGLMEALKSPAFYVGAIGSQSTNAQRRARLLQLDLTPEQVARLHGPVGLPIGSRTPPEIAIAILAEIIAERRKYAAGPSPLPAGGDGGGRSSNFPSN